MALPETLSKKLNKEYTSRFDKPEDFNLAVPRAVADRANGAKLRIRKAHSAAQAAPTDLKASLVRSTVSGFQLTWTDHANNEDGYLVEMKRDQSSNYEVRAVLDPGANAFGYAFTPPERQATLRGRAFYYGQPSNLAHEVPSRVLPEHRPATCRSTSSVRKRWRSRWIAFW